MKITDFKKGQIYTSKIDAKEFNEGELVDNKFLVLNVDLRKNLVWVLFDYDSIKDEYSNEIKKALRLSNKRLEEGEIYDINEALDEYFTYYELTDGKLQTIHGFYMFDLEEVELVEEY